MLIHYFTEKQVEKRNWSEGKEIVFKRVRYEIVFIGSPMTIGKGKTRRCRVRLKPILEGCQP